VFDSIAAPASFVAVFTERQAFITVKITQIRRCWQAVCGYGDSRPARPDLSLFADKSCPCSIHRYVLLMVLEERSTALTPVEEI